MSCQAAPVSAPDHNLNIIESSRWQRACRTWSGSNLC
ncbi:unnamed protein product, partial [Staurois parvus]